MPFLDAFGLTDYPFGLTPNPRLFYPTEPARALLAGLEFALMRGDGLIKVVGEVGTGKTLAARLLLEKLAAFPVNTAYLDVPSPALGQIPAAVAREFGLNVANVTAASRQLRKFLLEAHGAGKRNILIVDEAQALGAEGLEAVRLLSNLETESDKLLQIVLFGQKELDGLLHQPPLRQIAQRIQFSFVTEPMDVATTADYVRFRLERCLKPEALRAIFTPRALSLLARVSGGLPRLVHLLADKALLAAYADGKTRVSPRHVFRAVRETPDIRWGKVLWLTRFFRF
jgi:MSHA biogenesis protein MshM